MKLLALSALLATVTTLAAPAASAETMTWRVGSDTREAIVYLPTIPSPAGKAPLVFSFHGRGDEMENFQRTGMHMAWPQAIVVYFQGLVPPGRLRGWQAEKGQDDDRDLKLVDAALSFFRQKFNVDDNRIYATGFSNGANFTYLLWAERPDVFAAYAPVAARLAPSIKLTRPKPVFHVAGLQDPQIRFVEQEAAMEAAVRANGVAGTDTSCGTGCTIYGAKTAAPVMTWIHPRGHIYPADTSDRITKFFRDHTRKP